MDWITLKAKYEKTIGLGHPAGHFVTDQYEKFDATREWHCGESSFWGERNRSGSGKTRGVFWIAPHDDQWTKGYAFVPIDGATFSINNQGIERKFWRQMPAKGGYDPTDISDRSFIENPVSGSWMENTRKMGKNQFPHCALIYAPQVSDKIDSPYRKMFGKESRDPSVGNVSPWRIQSPWDIGHECSKCGSWEYIRDEKARTIRCADCGEIIKEGIDENVCMECGAKKWVLINDEKSCGDCGYVPVEQPRLSVSTKEVGIGSMDFNEGAYQDEEGRVFPGEGDTETDEVAIPLKSKGTVVATGSGRPTVKIPYLTPEPITISHSRNLFSKVKGGLPPKQQTRIQGMLDGSSFNNILVHINSRRMAGRMDCNSGQNAWVVWNKLRRQSKKLFTDTHFIVAGWLWEAKVGDELDNQLFKDLHCSLLKCEAICDREDPDWCPRDPLMVVEILRLMWWEIKGENPSNWWTAYPATVAP